MSTLIKSSIIIDIADIAIDSNTFEVMLDIKRRLNRKEVRSDAMSKKIEFGEILFMAVLLIMASETNKTSRLLLTFLISQNVS